MNELSLLRQLLPADSADAEVLRYAYENELLLVTCNRADFLNLATENPDYGPIIMIRRKTRAAERAAYSVCWSALEMPV